VKKILITVMAVVLCLGLMGAAFAYFSDTETSSGNTFTAGTLDLVLSDDDETDLDGVTATWVSPAHWAPGDTVEATLRIKNIGSIGSVNLFLKPTELVEVDGDTPEPEPAGVDNIADWINVTNFQITFKDTASGTPFLTYGNWAGDSGWMSQSPWSPWSTAPPLTLREFHNTPYKVWIFGSSRSDDALEANGADTIELTMTFEFEPTAPNDYQGDQCTMTFRVLTFNGPVEGGVIIWEGSGGYGYGNPPE